ncbi:hypothetical protein [Streptomyces sp. cg2]|uniref:hypothetical protein n=1 Tax=Streptomyces sp. cg2 TaxID=3238799 RepID=UPI0034E2DE07
MRRLRNGLAQAGGSAVPRAPRSVKAQPAARERTAGGLRTVLRDRAMPAFAGLVVLYTVLFQQAFATLPLAMKATGMSSAPTARCWPSTASSSSPSSR